MGKLPFTEDEVILDLELYLRIPKKDIRRNNELIIELSNFLQTMGIDRSVNSIKMKLENFKGLDPNYLGDGLSNFSALDRKVWDRFAETHFADLSTVAMEVRNKIANGRQFEFKHLTPSFDLDVPGEVRVYETKKRINQDIFRTRVLTAYGFKCCLTGVSRGDLLRASHIKPWSASTDSPCERLDPRNGLCLNAFHDAAFDRGLFTLDENLRVEVSPYLEELEGREFMEKWFVPYLDKRIEIATEQYLPIEDYLDYHRKHVFADTKGKLEKGMS